MERSEVDAALRPTGSNLGMIDFSDLSSLDPRTSKPWPSYACCTRSSAATLWKRWLEWNGFDDALRERWRYAALLRYRLNLV